MKEYLKPEIAFLSFETEEITVGENGQQGVGSDGSILGGDL